MMGAAVSTQKFSNFAHDCQEIEFNGDFTTVIGTNCYSESSTAAHTSWLNLDLCLSYDAPSLVAHQGYVNRRANDIVQWKYANMAHGSGGYVSNSKCTNCTGDDVYDYSCNCSASTVWPLARIDLSRLLAPSS